MDDDALEMDVIVLPRRDGTLYEVGRWDDDEGDFMHVVMLTERQARQLRALLGEKLRVRH